METILIEKLEELKNLTLLGVKKALTTKDVAILTGLSKSYIYKLVMNREIPFYKSNGGKIIYFNVDEINNWMFSHRFATKDEVQQQAEKYLQTHKN